MYKEMKEDFKRMKNFRDGGIKEGENSRIIALGFEDCYDGYFLLMEEWFIVRNGRLTSISHSTFVVRKRSFLSLAMFVARA